MPSLLAVKYNHVPLNTSKSKIHITDGILFCYAENVFILCQNIILTSEGYDRKLR